MFLAMAILLFPFPAITPPANAAQSALAARSVISAPATASAAATLPMQPTPSARPALVTAPRNSPSAASSSPAEPAIPEKVPEPAFVPASVPTPGLSLPLRTLSPADASPSALNALTGPYLANSFLHPPAAFRPPNEVPIEHRRFWAILAATEHSAAAYDAWSTRYALSHGRVEADPLMRPFAGSAAIYPAIQVVPFGLDFLAHRLQRSSGWERHIWWVPQAAATVTFLFSGSYNVLHTN